MNVNSVSKAFDYLIVGGGIVGLATAYQLSERFPERSICILEKESELAAHQSGHNSGVIHSGIYYKPSSKKALDCRRGYDLLLEFSKHYQIPHRVGGKLIVATHKEELERLQTLFERGQANQLSGIRKIGQEEIKEIEPYCAGIAAIHVPQTGVIDFKLFSRQLAACVRTKNEANLIVTGAEVKRFFNHPEYVEAYTEKGVFRAKLLIACAGLQADRVAQAQKAEVDTRTLPFRGDYYRLTETARYKVNNPIYPVPDPRFPFLGVHFTPRIDGEVECGPNAVFSFKREGYSTTDFDWRDTKDALGFGGTWRFFAKHWKFGLREYRRAWSKQLFLESLQRLMPSLTADEIEPARSGVRAMTLTPEGEMLDDFKIIYRERAIHVINAPSPAATASLSIGERIVDMAKDVWSV